MKKLKILHTVEFYAPSVGGAQEVVRQLSEHLALLGHDVTVATTWLPERKSTVVNGVKIKEFKISGNTVRGLNGEVEKYRQYLRKSKFDVVMNYAAQQWASDIFFDVIDEIKAKKIFVPCGFSGLYEPSYKEYFQKLPSILKKYDATVYLSHAYRDINFARRHHLKHIHIIGNGADEREFAKLPSVQKDKLREKYHIPLCNRIILQVANHTGRKGHQEAITAFLKAPMKDVSLVLIGDINTYAGCYNSCLRASKLNNYVTRYVRGDRKTIHVLHVSRQETLRFFAIADLFLFLSNIECSPLVLFEAAAAGIPFIASAAGNATEIASWLGNGIIAKSRQDKTGDTTVDISDVSKKLQELMSDQGRRTKLGSIGHRRWMKKYTWVVLANAYEKLYRQ